MTETTWNGFKRLDFEFDGMSAILVFPDIAIENKNWLLKTEYFNAFPEFEIKMLERGWHLAYIKNKTRWCLDEDIERKKHFVDYITKEYGLYPKCLPVGMSCGGMIAFKLAARFPHLVSALYLDAPVMNLLSCPAGIGDAGNELFPEFINATGMSLSELISYRDNPIDNMASILKNNIPVMMVYGDKDTVVPDHENGALYEDFCKKNGGIISVIKKINCGHHPHGLNDNTPIIYFAEKYAK